MRIRSAGATTGHQSVDLVEKDDAGRSLARFAKYLTHASLGFPHIFRKQFRPFDRDEIHITFAGHRFGEKGFSASWGTRKQNSLRRPDPGLVEQVGVLERPLDGFHKALFDLGQTPDVLPTHVGNFDKYLAKCGRFYVLEGLQEIIHSHLELGQLIIRNSRQAEVHIRHDASQAYHRCFPAKGFQVGPHETVRDLRQAIQVYLFGQGHASAMDFKDLLAPMAVGNRDADLPVKPPWPPQGRIEHIGQVGRRYDDDLLPLGEPVHQSQQLSDHSLLNLAHHLLAAGSNGVDLIQEDDAGGLAAALFENLPQMRFTLAVELVDNFGTADSIEIRLGLMRNGAGNQRLAASRRPVEKHTFGRVDPQALEDLGVTQGQFDHFADTLELGLQAADVLIGNCAGGHLLRLGPLRDHQLRHGVDEHGTLGHRAFHLEIRPAGSKQDGPDAARSQNRQAIQPATDIIQIALGWSDVRGGQHHPLGGRAGDLAHLNELVQPRPGILARDSVQLNPGLPAQVLVGRHRLAHASTLADYFQDVSHAQLQKREILRPHARVSATHVLAERFTDFELE